MDFSEEENIQNIDFKQVNNQEYIAGHPSDHTSCSGIHDQEQISFR
jgi:hypothetical protein